MTFTSLDAIVKNILLKRRYSIHFYIDFLIYAKDGLREISMDDDINPIRYKVLPVDNTNGNVAQLPNDYMDYTRVAVRQDQYLHPLVEDNSLDLIPNFDTNFQVQPYSQGIASQSQGQNQEFLYNGVLSAYWFMVNWDSFGENLGRQFGGIGVYTDTFRINKAQNQIKINENLCVPEIVLEYVSNGMDSDAATHINSYAQMAIETFALWQFYLHNRTYSTGDAMSMEQSHIKERQILRARLSDITIDQLKRIAQKNAIRVKY